MHWPDWSWIATYLYGVGWGTVATLWATRRK